MVQCSLKRRVRQRLERKSQLIRIMVTWCLLGLAPVSSTFVQTFFFPEKAAQISLFYFVKVEKCQANVSECVGNISSSQVISLASLYCHPAVIKETKILQGLNILLLLLFKKQIIGYSLFAARKYEQTTTRRMETGHLQHQQSVTV